MRPGGGLPAQAAQLAQRRGHAGPVGRVGLGAVVHVALLDEVRRIAQRARGVVEQALLLRRVVAAEQRAGLAEVVAVVLAEIPEIGIAADAQRRLAVLWLLLPLAVACLLYTSRCV